MVSAFPEVHAKTLTEVTFLALDLDLDDVLTFILDWGDGTTTFTGVVSAKHDTLVTVLSLGNWNQHGRTKG